MMQNFLNLLNQGISSEKDFYTAPFEVRNEDRPALAHLGTAGGTAYKDGVAVVVAQKGELDFSKGIRYVFLNDAYFTQQSVDQFNLVYSGRGMTFALLSQQKAVLENEFTQGQYQQWRKDNVPDDATAPEAQQADPGQEEEAEVPDPELSGGRPEVPSDQLPALPDVIYLDVSGPSDDKVGGIDFNAKSLDLQTKGQSIEFNLPPEWQDVDFNSIQGFVPIISNIAPIANFNALLGLNKEDGEAKLEVRS
jgi:hypothetical protein